MVRNVSAEAVISCEATVAVEDCPLELVLEPEILSERIRSICDLPSPVLVESWASLIFTGLQMDRGCRARSAVNVGIVRLYLTFHLLLYQIAQSLCHSAHSSYCWVSAFVF